MVKSSLDNSIADFYYDILNNLDKDSKLDLISRLSQSLKDEKPKPDTSLESLFGAYQSDESAEEIIESIRNSRLFNRSIETL